MHETRSRLAPLVFVTLTVLLGLYFAFASIQGDYGLFRRLQVEAEAKALQEDRDRLKAEVAALENGRGGCRTTISTSTCSTSRRAASSGWCGRMRW